MDRPIEDNEWVLSPEEETLDIVSEQASFLQEVSILMAALPGLRQATSENHAYRFEMLPLSAPLELPEALRPLRGAIDMVTIDIGDAHTAESPKDADRPAYLSIDFIAKNDIYTISRSGEEVGNEYDISRVDLNGRGRVETNDTFDKRLSKIGSASQAEINSLMMGIVLPNSIGDYSAYADKELQSPAAFDSLCELLSQKALSQHDTFHFELNESEIDLHFTKENGQTTSFTLSYFDEKRNLPISVEYDIASDFALRFFSFEDGSKSVIIPTAQEINYARSLLKKELSGAEPERYQVERGVIVEPESTTPDHEHQLSNELAGMVDAALEQLGLNPPNTSA